MNQQVIVALGDITITAPQQTVARALLAAAFGDAPMVPPIPASMAPKVGTFWPAQGGINLGLVTGENDEPDYYLIQPLDPLAYLKAMPLGTYGDNVSGACHKRDGLANTKALAEAGSELCKQILALEIDGFADFYLPAQLEQNLQYHYGGESFVKEWHWSSTQYSSLSAFGQTFNAGHQNGGVKSYSFRARAVRRFFIQ